MKKIQFPPPCIDFMQAELLEIGKGTSRIRFVPTKDMENPFYITLGGLLAAMLDIAMGPAVGSIAEDRLFTTLQMSTHFICSVKTGQALIGTAKVVKHGRRQAYVEAKLHRESDEKLIATATSSVLFLDVS